MKKGFTLIELLVVIVIIGVLSVISVASFNNYQEKARLAKAQAFAAQFQKQVRTQVIEEGQVHTFYSSYENNSVSQSAPYLTDWSGSVNNAVTTTGGTHAQSTDVPAGNGNSLRIDKRFLATVTLNNGPTNKITMATWVKLNEFSVTSSFPMFIHSKAHLQISADGSVLFYVNNDAVNSVAKSSAGVVELDKWYYLVGSYDGDSNTIRLWIDGELTDEQNVVLTTPFSNFPAYLYLGYEASIYQFDGWLDDTELLPFPYTGD